MADVEEQSGWQLTESDPGVFTELLTRLGTSLIMDELYTLSYDTLLADPLSSIAPIKALIFLFKWTAEREGDETSEGGGGRPRTGGSYDPNFGENGGFYAKQVVNNACATLAIVNALGNIQELKVGDVLGNIFSFGIGMDALTLGEVLTSSDELREIHNSLSPPSAISLGDLNLPKGEAQEAYHFVVYIPTQGSLYELDGLKRAAVNHGPIPESQDWLQSAFEVIERRIGLYEASAIEFNLQALRSDPLPALEAVISDPSSLPAHLTSHDIQDLLQQEKSKRTRWQFENAIRRHNHLGLAVELLQALAKASIQAERNGAGESLWNKTVENAKSKMKERIERRRELKKAGVDMEVDG